MTITLFLKKNKWICLTLLVLIIVIKLFSQNNLRVETFYTNGFYYYAGVILRILFGWIPFSFGDILYFIAGLWLTWKIIKNLILLFKRRLTLNIFFLKLLKIIFLSAFIYIVFNILWALNYNRKGIAWQLHLNEAAYDTTTLKIINSLLLEKVNETKKILINQKTFYPDNKNLFKRAQSCYAQAEKLYPFIQYKKSSVKSSMYGWLGNYLGFTGYYNPFTGEAQVNTTVPRFLLPYITLHEIGHQIGYAKEDEANFSGYLAGANSSDTLFQYSTYLDLFIYSNREIFYFDSAISKNTITQLIPEVRADLREWKRFNEEHTSFLEPAISWLYGKYLQVNQQPKGLRSYNEVISMIVAYYKKYSRI